MPRPPEYDRDTVISQAMTVFWERGYSQTSVSDLVDATGLGPGSLYAAFGNKKGVFLEVLDQYNRAFLDAIRQMRDSNVLFATRNLLDDIIDQTVAGRDHRGCLSVNALLEMSQHDEDIAGHLARQNDAVRKAFAALFAAGQERGEIGERADAEALASFLVNNIWGMRVACRSKPDRHSLESIVESVMVVLESR
jgi:TetR/AcrR family transcriptional repressor of nem operon